MATSTTSPTIPVPARRPGAPVHAGGLKVQGQVELDDHYLIALAKQGRKDAYDRIVKRYQASYASRRRPTSSSEGIRTT